MKKFLQWCAGLALLLAIPAFILYQQAPAQFYLRLGDFDNLIQLQGFARDAYRRSAEAGNLEAQVKLARFYENGLGGNRDLAEARAWLERAAAQNHQDAQKQLATYYEHGRGGDKDEAGACLLYQKSGAISAAGRVCSKLTPEQLAARANAFSTFGSASPTPSPTLASASPTASATPSPTASAGPSSPKERWAAIDKATEDGDFKRAFQLLQPLAEGGDAQAQFRLADYYAGGLGTKKNPEEVRYWLVKAAKQNHAEAQNRLGQLYEQGQGMERDYRFARELYEQAARQGQREAQQRLARLLEQGQGGDRDEVRACQLYTAAGDREAISRVCGGRNTASAQQALQAEQQRLAQQSLSEEQRRRQVAIDTALQQQRDELARQAEQQRQATPLAVPVPPTLESQRQEEEERARQQAAQQAAQARQTDAQLAQELAAQAAGNEEEPVNPPPTNPNAGADLLDAVAEPPGGRIADPLAAEAKPAAPAVSQEEANAAFDRGDYHQAFIMNRQLAEGGSAEAQNALGYLYEKGLGTKQNYDEALVYYERAAHNGNRSAQFNTAVLYENGLGTDRDLQQARFWYEHAAAQGDDEAAEALERLND